MMTRKLCWMTAFLLTAVCTATAAADEPAPHREQIARAVQQLDGLAADDDAIWAHAVTLRSVGGEGLDALREAAAEADSGAARLALGWALISLRELDAGIGLLASVVTSDEPLEARLAAARILGDRGRHTAEIEITDLLDKAEDGRLRVALARSLMRAATTEQAQAKAVTALVRVVRAEQDAARADAALALAELDDFRDPVPEVLAGLADKPTDRGRLAQKLLELYRLSQLMLREKEYSGSLGNPLLEEIKSKIMEYHIDPPDEEASLVDAAARGMTESLHATDPFSDYLSPDHWEAFRNQISGTYGGIGAHVRFLKDPETGEDAFTCVKPIYSGPAYEAGLRAYDQFLEIDGEPVEGKSTNELTDLLRGTPGSVVKCKVRRIGLEEDEILDLEIVRQPVSVSSVRHELLPGGIGYLRLEHFGDRSADEVETAMRELGDAGMNALIFDVRQNPGGLLLAARDIADKFLTEDKLITYSEGRNPDIAPRRDLRTTAEATHPNVPMVTLVDGASGSASELVAGALQDHKRATLVGERTFGKGSVQQLMQLDATGRQAALKLTIAQYYLPSGRSIHRTPDNRGGVVPDIELPHEQPWEEGLFERFRAAGDFQRYSLRHWPEHKETLMELAEFDHLDHTRYPGFDDWFEGLKIKTDKGTARRLLRQWLRVLTADELGRDWAGDLQEDNQYQRAVYEAARRLEDFDPRSVPRFRPFIDEIERRRERRAEKKQAEQE